MAMYAIAVMPLIDRINNKAKQIWFADDATAGGRLNDLREWWYSLSELGPGYGYFVNSSKSWLIVKEKDLDEAQHLFQNTGINITHEGRRHLGAALGTPSFVKSYVMNKVQIWYKEIQQLADFALTQPHAAHAAYTHGLIGR